MNKLPSLPDNGNEELAGLTWCDIQYGIMKEVLPLTSAIEFAITRIDSKALTELETDLAGLNKNQSTETRLLLEKIIANQHCEESVCRDNILKIYLKWIVTKTDFIDTDEYIVDEIYFHFDRPNILEDCLSFSIVNDKNRNRTTKELLLNAVQ